MLARMPKRLKPRAVVLGLILENDVIATNCEKVALKQKKEAGEPPKKQKNGKFVPIRRLT